MIASLRAITTVESRHAKKTIKTGNRSVYRDAEPHSKGRLLTTENSLMLDEMFQIADAHVQES